MRGRRARSTGERETLGAEMLRIAHVSDLHVLSPHGVELRRVLFNKRLTGYANLVLRRGRMYRRDYLEAVLAAAAQRSDHVVVTGDVTNLSLESEYAEACRLLDEIARVTEVTVVPGNHDIYLPSTARGRRFWRHFEPFLRGDLPEFAIDLPAGRFPCVKLRGPAAFIALSSAVPRPPFVSAGYVSRAPGGPRAPGGRAPSCGGPGPPRSDRLAPAPRAAPERARGRERAAQRTFECRARTRPLRPPPHSPSQPAHDGGGHARGDLRQRGGARSSRRAGPRRLQPLHHSRRRRGLVQRGLGTRSCDARVRAP